MERHIEVTRTARYHVLGPEETPAQETWFVLHGYQQLAGRFVVRFRPLVDGSRRIVAPEALSRFYVSQAPGRHGPESRVGATWMTREDRMNEIRDYVAYLDALQDRVRTGDPEEARLVVLGFSQGVATAARWVTLGRVRPDRLVLWGDHLPPDLDLERAASAFSGVDVVLARGSRDRVLASDMAEREERALSGAGIRYRVVEYDGGHEIDQHVVRELAGTPF